MIEYFKFTIFNFQCRWWSGATSLFDPPEADKCLLAFGEFNVGRSMFNVHL
jgi:hypothetical protein